MDLDQVKSYNEDVAKLREQRDADYAECWKNLGTGSKRENYQD